MAEPRHSRANAGHFTRSQMPKPIAQKPLKIVPDKKKLPLEGT